MSSAALNSQMLLIGRKAVGKTQIALAHEVGVSQALLSKIENGLESAAPDLVDRLASACEVPTSFLYQDAQVLGEGLIDFFHRKRRTLPAKPLDRAHAEANKVRLEVGNLTRTLALTDVAALPQVPPGEEMEPEEAAALARATWRVPPGPLPDLVGLLEAAGIVILTMGLGHEKLAAISMPGAEHGAYVIVLNSDLPASMQRFTLAHELGHLVMHYANTPPADLEEQADRFAAALLMPRSDINSDLRDLQFRDLGVLKHKWRTSLAALIRRAKDTGNISDRQYRTFNIKLSNLRGGRRHEPGEFAPEIPRLARYLIDHYQTELGYSFNEVCKLMHAQPDRVRSIYYGQSVRTLKPIARPVQHLSLARP